MSFELPNWKCFHTRSIFFFLTSCQEVEGPVSLIAENIIAGRFLQDTDSDLQGYEVEPWLTFNPGLTAS